MLHSASKEKSNPISARHTTAKIGITRKKSPLLKSPIHGPSRISLFINRLFTPRAPPRCFTPNPSFRKFIALINVIKCLVSPQNNPFGSKKDAPHALSGICAVAENFFERYREFKRYFWQLPLRHACSPIQTL